ncbi:putative protein-RNA complex protein translation initiation [uncultured phage cr2_1]|uniref:Uncharacterized protein n=1 Tax=uncultured phage cr2_1 TaxID=2986394 RepID=A0AAE7V538_9CAUD|nr:putative protein-RNA complex protein translation initiation [uncultured phage cr2_1]QWM90461.1 putative protein-RNA complex protein translation initiation [uncultured phage cr2_1]
MPNPIVPGGVTDSNTTKTAEEIAAEQVAKAAKEAEEAAKAEEERKKAEDEETKRKAEEEAAKTATQKTETETETPTKIVLTTDDGDIEYDLDADGNAVKDGEIIYTKAQLDEFAAVETQEETIDVSAISAISGLTPVNADGTPKQYEMTVEGLAQRDADIAEIARHQAESEAINNFFRTNPDIYQAALYKQTYGSLEGFANHVDWTTMTLEDKSDDQLEAVIRSAEKRKGTSDAQIERIIRFSKADKVLNETAKESLDYLAANQKREIEEATARQEAQWKAEQDELDKAYGITYDDHGKAKVLNVPDSLYDKIVNKGTIGGLTIPTAGVKRTVNGKEQILTRKDLVKYLTAPVVEIGDSLYTQAQKDVFDMLADNETFAMIALRNLLGTDISQLAAASIRQEAVRRLNITSSGKPKVKVSTQGGGTKVNPNRRPIVPGGIIDSNK